MADVEVFCVKITKQAHKVLKVRMGTLGNQDPVHTKESQMFGDGRLWFRSGEGTISVLFVHYFPVLTSDLATISAKERL